MQPEDSKRFLKQIKTVADKPTKFTSLKPSQKVNSEPSSLVSGDKVRLNLNLLFEREVKRKEETTAEQGNRTLREIMGPVVNHQPFCIRIPAGGTPFELNSSLLQQLPTFHGLSGENAYTHLDQFHVVCSSMKPSGVTDEQIQLRAFPFSLADAAKEWLHSLPVGSITTWAQIERAFLEKYFPISKAVVLSKEISGIQQHPNETMYEYWQRFQKLLKSCPNHQLSEQLLAHYFFLGMRQHDRELVDAASGGAFLDKNDNDAMTLLRTMAITKG